MSTQLVRRPWADLAAASLGNSTPHIAAPISRGRGPVVRAFIEPSTSAVEGMRQAGKQPPAPIPAVLAVDTGAHTTCIATDLLRRLGLPHVGEGSIDPGWGFAVVPCKQYLIDLLIPQTGGVALRVQNLGVLDSYVRYIRHPVDGLLGRDLLANARFAYSGPDNWFAISFLP